MGKILLITGTSGYIGSILVEQFSMRSDVEKIIGLDLVDCPENLKENPKFIFIKGNIADDDWQEEVEKHSPEIVIHAAWQIREMFRDKEEQYKRNIMSSESIFDYVFSAKSVERLVYYSTVASYSARKENKVEHLFNEEEPLRESVFLYAEQKRESEKMLKNKYEEAKNKPKIFVIRPASITGPRFRKVKKGFNMQNIFNKKTFPFMLVTSKWCRQFIHEDDITDITSILSFDNLDLDYETFNLAPPNSVIGGKRMGEIMNKKTIQVSPLIVKFIFFWARVLTGGKIPTARGGWKSFSYPINVDGSKITKLTNYEYKFASEESVSKNVGRYARK
jgi:nucleoside-diphosphate-sugar epimerase